MLFKGKEGHWLRVVGCLGRYDEEGGILAGFLGLGSNHREVTRPGEHGLAEGPVSTKGQN